MMRNVVATTTRLEATPNERQQRKLDLNSRLKSEGAIFQSPKITLGVWLQTEREVMGQRTAAPGVGVLRA